MAGLLRPLVNQDLAAVFYNMSTICTARLPEQEDDVRKFGMSKEGVMARQVMLGVVHPPPVSDPEAVFMLWRGLQTRP